MIEQYKNIIFGILSDKPIAYHPDIAKMLKSTTACVFLSQLLYWSGRGNSEWIYKTQDEWHEETGLSRREQETARKKLRDMGILQEVRKGQPSRLFYRIDFERLTDCLAEYYRKPGETDPHEPNSSKMTIDSVQSSMAETANLECTNPPNKNGGMRHSIYTENTTENTTYVVVDVVEPPAEKKQKEPIREKVAANDTTITELQQQAEKVCGVRIPPELLAYLVTEYGIEKVSEKISMLGGVETRNAPGFLVAALQDDYVFMPGRPQQQQKRASPGGRAVRRNTQTRAREPDTAEALERKKLIQSLYMS